MRKLFLLGALLSASVAADPRPIRIQLPTDPASLDPHRLSDFAGLKIAANTFEALLQYDGQGRLQPKLAESYTISADRRTYVFKLRRQAKWSDGSPLLASQFVTGFLRTLNPQIGWKFAASLFPIENARAIFEGKSPPSSLGVTARDEGDTHTLTIRLAKPCGHFLHLITMPVFAPSRAGTDWKVGDPSPGPYFVAEREQERRILLRRNPYYYGPAPHEDIELLIVTDDSTAASLFQAGKLDLLTKLAAIDAPRLASYGVVRSDPSSSTTALTLNPGRAPLTDRDLRRAIAGAIDKPGVIRAVGHPEVLAFGLLPPGFDAYRATAAATQPVPAKLGAYAGLPPISALIDSSSSNSVILEKIQADVLARLGLRLEIQAQEWKGFIGRVLRDPPPLFRMSWPAWYRDPYSFLENYTTGHPANILKWSNARYDRVLAQLAEAAPGPRRRRLAEQAQQILVDDEAVLVPLFHVRYQHAISRALQGFNLTSLGVIDFSRLNWLPKK